ncbi:MAG TPA: trigger factor [Stellaceae bacterium]|nr:trigger factor [Stellaceae bacterium]
MQITETATEGLKREFKVVIPASDIEHRITSRLTEIGRSVRLPGFRPGKVPMTVLKKRYGSAVMGEVLERAVNDTSGEALREQNLRPALQPKVEIVAFNEGTDLEFKLAVEVLPEIQPMDFAELKLERLRPEVPEAEVQEALERVAKQQRKSEAVERAAETGDVVVIDFKGSVDGKEFPGGSAEGYSLELGTNSFIPGFEDQMAGAKTGETRTVSVTFPADYGAADLAGKAAAFEVKVKEVRALQPQPLDDSLAQAVGMEKLDELRQSVSEQIERNYEDLARQRLKRTLLDRLAERHEFAVPEGMVDIEFGAIWRQFEQERVRQKAAGDAEPEDAINEEELKVEYRGIAERRVRLGLLLAEVGRNHNITVTPEEINRALTERARQFPGQERRVIEYYRNHPEAIDQIRAPMFEDKVIDFILERAEVTERRVPVSELLKDDEDEAAEKASEGEAKAKEQAAAKATDETTQSEPAAAEGESEAAPKKGRGKKKS